MKLTHLRTNHVTKPLGLELQKPVFSWVAEETAAKKQTAAQITVKDGAGKTVFDSGRREDISSLGFEADMSLTPRTRYTWEITVWADNGDSASASDWFETAKEQEAWEAGWIAADFSDKERHPLLAKDFTVSEEIESARAYVCGLGIYELEINGRKAGDEYLLPGYHCYDANLEYQTFDVTGLLTAGDNTIGLALGPGWYKGDIVFDRYHNLYGDTMEAICELRILKKDGTEQVVVSDGSWKSYPSPVTFSNIYDGEHFDARRQVSGWSSPHCAAEHGGVTLRDEQRALTARLSPKIVKKQETAPVEIIYTKKDEIVLDFGQNMTGWVEFTCREPAGTEVALTYGEVMQDECFYRDNLRSAKAEYRYISDGRPARVRPHFTFYGFRFVKVEGVKDVRAEDFSACHIRSDIDPIGSIETDNPLVNRLFQNAMWGQFDNFLDVPTDCPQRDERLGWTGDAAIISATACKNIYMPAFFHHFIQNVGLEQQCYGGSVPFFVPAPKPKTASDALGIDLDPADFLALAPDDKAGLNAALEKYPPLKAAMEKLPPEERPAYLEKIVQENMSFIKSNDKGTAIWSDVATMMPWAVYENYGDRNFLRREYPVMKTWVERIRRDDRLDGDRGLWLRGSQLGDWLALDREDGDTQNPFGATDLAYTATAFYWYSTSLTAKAAKALGYTGDQKEYEGLCEKIRGAFLKEYFEADGTLKIHATQTACVLSLFFGLYPDGKRDAVLNTLKTLLQENGMHLNTGFCGTPFLCRALSDNGANEDAYTLFLNNDYPSWLYEVKMGATTVWERWNSILPDGSISGTGMNSLNHYAYGSIADWMYRDLCGLNPCEDAPGYKKAVIRPLPDPRIRFARLHMDSAAGRYEVEWRYDGEALHYAVTVPFDCEAELCLPDGTTHCLTAGSYQF
ncbi:family 78 glycoside hydrolase catalytic domain [uncultured Neglectibacter sp.]|uniref:alpha-L-rhamnosidase n=1 Tax=uncultured Neglectibacter sp. TaxID=1924108 RepID=UPI0034DF3C1C